MKLRIDPLDQLFSIFIRLRALKRSKGCERCLQPKSDIKQLHCAHFHGRSRKSVRYDEDNAAGLCYGCHSYLDAHPLEKITFFEGLLGKQKYDLLNSRMRITWPKPDKKALEIYYRQKIKELQEALYVAT